MNVPVVVDDDNPVQKPKKKVTEDEKGYEKANEIRKVERSIISKYENITFWDVFTLLRFCGPEKCLSKANFLVFRSFIVLVAGLI